VSAFGLTEGILPAHPRLKPDELFSSWVVRTAIANQTRLYSLVRGILGESYHLFHHVDIDRGVTHSILEDFAKATSTPTIDIWRSTLSHEAMHINDVHERNGHTLWLVPFGFVPRQRRQTGIQYCPICLKLDKQPYFRKSWRLAYYTECERHHVLMEDTCPHCQAPVGFFQLKLGDWPRDKSMGLNRCFKCDGALSDAMPKRSEWPELEHGLAVRSILLSQGLDFRFIERRIFRPASSLMKVLRMLIGALCSRSSRGELYDHLASQLWPYGYTVLSNRGTNFEFRTVEERHRLFGLAVWLLMDWPRRLEAACMTLRLSDAQLTFCAKDMPAWFYLERRPYLPAARLNCKSFKLS
jgi:hypothetical protein